jgi:hypothetical protein
MYSSRARTPEFLKGWPWSQISDVYGVQLKASSFKENTSTVEGKNAVCVRIGF